MRTDKSEIEAREREKKERREREKREKKERRELEKRERAALKVKKGKWREDDAPRRERTLEELQLTEEQVAELFRPIRFEKGSKALPKAAEPKKPINDTDNKYKIMKFQLRDRQGNLYTIERRVR